MKLKICAYYLSHFSELTEDISASKYSTLNLYYAVARQIKNIINGFQNDKKYESIYKLILYHIKEIY